MLRYLIIAAVLVGAATSVPTFLKGRVNEASTQAKAPPAERSPEVSYDSASAEPDNPLAGRFTRIDADRRGHFVATARMNGRPAQVLVDTGATLVAINESTARRIGIRLQPADFKYRVNTANGQTRAAAAMIEEIEIGRVIVRNVEASVLKDEALSGTLLGMSFLGKLKRFGIESGTLVLSQ